MSRSKRSKTLDFLAQVTPDAGLYWRRFAVMQPFREASVLRFGPFEFNLERRMLRKHGVRIKLQTQPFQILAALLEKPGTTVTRDELRRRLWPDNTFVDFEHGLNAAVARLRQALGDSPEQPRYIETVAKFGYRFAAKLEGESEDLIVRLLGEDRAARNARDMPRAAAPSGGRTRRLTVGRKEELAKLKAAFQSAARAAEPYGALPERRASARAPCSTTSPSSCAAKAPPVTSQKECARSASQVVKLICRCLKLWKAWFVAATRWRGS